MRYENYHCTPNERYDLKYREWVRLTIWIKNRLSGVLQCLAGLLFVRPTWAITWRWKSATRLAVGSVSRTARVSIVRWNLKEAEGKVPNRRTEIAYKAEKGWTSLQHKMKSNTARIPASKCGGYMGWRLLHLIRGGLRGKLPTRGTRIVPQE